MKILRYFFPPDRWKIPVIIILGILTGLGLFIFKISKAHSYLSDSPTTCVNCHIMAPQYTTWNHSSHREQATCNDCHVPHNNIFSHYFFKAKDGSRHSYMFALRLEPQVIFIHKAGKEVVHQNCIRCHEQLLSGSLAMERMTDLKNNRTERKCWECHRETPHGRVNSLSSVPYARVPVPGSPVPKWLKNLMKKNE
jgi:cytochrome c nitrite reductase small subunit